MKTLHNENQSVAHYIWDSGVVQSLRPCWIGRRQPPHQPPPEAAYGGVTNIKGLRPFESVKMFGAIYNKVIPITLSQREYCHMNILLLYINDIQFLIVKQRLLVKTEE